MSTYHSASQGFSRFHAFFQRKGFFKILVLAMVSGIALTAGAVTRTWDGSTSASWNTGTNWSGSVVPGSNDDAIIGSAPNNDVDLTSSSLIGVNNVTLLAGSGAILDTFGNRLLVDHNHTDGTLDIQAGTAVIVRNAVSTLSPELDADVLRVDGGDLVLQGGALVEVDDILWVLNGGEISGVGTMMLGGAIGVGASLGTSNSAVFRAGSGGTGGTLRLEAAPGRTFSLVGTFISDRDGLFGMDAASHLILDGEIQNTRAQMHFEVGRGDSITLTGTAEISGGSVVMRGGNGSQAATLTAGGAVWAGQWFGYHRCVGHGGVQCRSRHRRFWPLWPRPPRAFHSGELHHHGLQRRRGFAGHGPGQQRHAQR